MVLSNIDLLLFLTYLTKYNIAHIYEILNSGDHKDLKQVTEEYLRKINNVDSVSQATVDLKFKEAYSDSKLAFEKLKYNGIKVLTVYDKNYPRSLRKLTDKPPILYYKGDLKECDLAAVIGSRKISANANSKTSKVVNILADHHYGIVSGLALGIDKLAHEAALKLNAYTIAVLPTSLDSIYPINHYRLANQILDRGGCLVSEIPLGINRGKKSFVERNRIQAALSNVVVPIEMSINSGTMHTINFTLRFKKDLFLIKPVETDDLAFYEGILYLIEKHHKKEGNIHVIAGINAFIESLTKVGRNSSVGVQGSLF